MITYVLKIMYDGSFYSGYAKQKNGIRTIQGELEEKLELFFGEKITTFASGRTDKFVHAIDQTVHFKVGKNIDLSNIQKFLNRKLEHIYVKKIEIVPKSFHSRFSIKSKVYIYIINTSEFNIFRKRYEYQYNKNIDLNKLNEVKNIFIGTKNFLSFSTSSLENTIRKIDFLEAIQINNKVIIIIKGNGFLRNMVRMIVATLIKYSEGKITKEKIIELLENPKKGSSIEKVPGCGLYLYKTIY